MEKTIQILLNGQPQTVITNLSINQLLDQFKIEQKHVAVAHNDQILPLLQRQITYLKEGDKIEIIRAVAGG